MSRTRDQSQGIIDYVSPNYGANGLVGKNVVVNGDCSVSQLNGTTLITPVNGTWPIDMASAIFNVASKLQTQQIVTQSTLGYTAALVISTLAQYTPAAGDAFGIRFAVEMANFTRFNY